MGSGQAGSAPDCKLRQPLRLVSPQSAQAQSNWFQSLNASSELTISRRTVFLVLNHASARKGSVTSAVYIQCFYGREKRDALE